MAEATSNVEFAHDVAVMREFLRTPYYSVLIKYYNLMLDNKRERVLTANRNTFEYWQGVYMGTKDAIELPLALIAEADRQAEMADAGS